MKGVDNADPPQFVYAALHLPRRDFIPLASSLLPNIPIQEHYIYKSIYADIAAALLHT